MPVLVVETTSTIHVTAKNLFNTGSCRKLQLDSLKDTFINPLRFTPNVKPQAKKNTFYNKKNCLDTEVTASLSVWVYLFLCSIGLAIRHRPSGLMPNGGCSGGRLFYVFVCFSIEIARQPPFGWLAHRHIPHSVLDSLAVILCGMHDYKLAHQMKRFLKPLIYLTYPTGKEAMESVW